MRKLKPIEKLFIKSIDSVGLILKNVFCNFCGHHSDSSKKFVKNILIFEPWNIGDYIISSYSFSVCKKEFPNARITVLCKPLVEPIAKCCKEVDEVITFLFSWTNTRQTYHIFSKLISFFFLVLEIRKRNFDLAITGRADFRHNIILWLFGAKHRIGYGSRGGGFFLTHSIKDDSDNQNSIEKWTKVIQSLGITDEIEACTYQFPEFALSQAQKLIDNSGVCKSDIILGIHPGASDPSKEWPYANFEKVAINLSKCENVKIFMISQPSGVSKKNLSDSIVILPELDLRTLACLLGKIDLLLCNDSGPMHLSAAVRTSVVALFGVTDPNEWGPKGFGHSIIKSPITDCRECYLDCRCKKPHSWLCISVSDVTKAVKKQLEIVKAKRMN